MSQASMDLGIFQETKVTGPVDRLLQHGSNHVQLQNTNTNILLSLRALQSTHARRTARIGKRGENGDGTRQERGGRDGGGSMRKGTVKGESGKSGGGQRRPGRKKEPVGSGCVGVLGCLRVGRCRLGSAPITSVMGVTVDWSRNYWG